MLPAFSVMETVVSMIIIAIVMGLVFVIFAILSERMLDFKNQNQLVADMNRLTYAINKDMFENQNVMTQDGNVAFVGYAGNSTVYKRYPDFMVREGNVLRDTFRIAVVDLILDTVKSQDSRIVFHRLRMNFDLYKQPADFKFYKKINADRLIENCK